MRLAVAARVEVHGRALRLARERGLADAAQAAGAGQSEVAIGEDRGRRRRAPLAVVVAPVASRASPAQAARLDRAAVASLFGIGEIGVPGQRDAAVQQLQRQRLQVEALLFERTLEGSRRS